MKTGGGYVIAGHVDRARHQFAHDRCFDADDRREALDVRRERGLAGDEFLAPRRDLGVDEAPGKQEVVRHCVDRDQGADPVAERARPEHPLHRCGPAHREREVQRVRLQSLIREGELDERVDRVTDRGRPAGEREADVAHPILAVDVLGGVERLDR